MVKHVCATIESGDIDDIRLNKRGKWDRGIWVRGIWVVAIFSPPPLRFFLPPPLDFCMGGQKKSGGAEKQHPFHTNYLTRPILSMAKHIYSN